MALKRYNTIKTIPYHNWREATNDIRWVRIGFDEYAGDFHEKKNPDGNVQAQKEDYKAFEILQEEFVSHFGMNDTVLELHNLQKEFWMASINALFDPIYQNDVWRLQHEIEELMSESAEKVTSDIDSQLIHVERWLGREVNLRVTSVFKLAKIQKEFEKYCKEQKALIEKHKAVG